MCNIGNARQTTDFLGEATHLATAYVLESQLLVHLSRIMSRGRQTYRYTGDAQQGSSKVRMPLGSIKGRNRSEYVTKLEKSELEITCCQSTSRLANQIQIRLAILSSNETFCSVAHLYYIPFGARSAANRFLFHPIKYMSIRPDMSSCKQAPARLRSS